MFKRFVTALALAALALPATGASADPIDLDHQLSPQFDCYNYTWSDPVSPADYSARDAENQHCMTQRSQDRRAQALDLESTATYGTDSYRNPLNPSTKTAGVRFRYETQIVDNLFVEVYRPCRSTGGDCPALPSGLARFDGPYPVVITMHGLISTFAFQWWAAQSLAESGYLVVNVNSGMTGATTAHAQTVLNWITSGANPYRTEMDLNRIGISGHSLGGGATFNTMRADPRIAAAVDEDDYSSSTAPADRYKPTLFIFADSPDFPGGNAHAYATPPANAEAVRGDGGKYDKLKAEAVDTMKLVVRATTHVDWVGNGAIGANRYWEGPTVWYLTAWFDRYLKGKIIPTESDSRQAAAKSLADDAYARLTATNFDGSQDLHNISMGLWDPAKAAASLDPIYGGNVPYTIGTQAVRDRMSFYWNSDCYLTRPDGTSHADVTDIRTNGCT